MVASVGGWRGHVGTDRESVPRRLGVLVTRCRPPAPKDGGRANPADPAARSLRGLTAPWSGGGWGSAPVPSTTSFLSGWKKGKRKDGVVRHRPLVPPPAAQDAVMPGRQQ